MYRKLIYFIVFISLAYSQWGCAKSKVGATVDNSPIVKVRQSISNGNYDEGINAAKEINAQAPPNPFLEESLYLQGYALAFGRSDFQGARPPLKRLLELFPTGKYAPSAQKLLSDCQFWQGHYQTAGKEYKKLGTLYSSNTLEAYSLLQSGNCLLLDDKVDEALVVYRELLDKYPADPFADSAQIMIANSYLKLQNFKRAKLELQKLMSLTHDGDIQRAAQKTLQQIEEESSRKGDGGS
jgi:TolA-binding protein